MFIDSTGLDGTAMPSWGCEVLEAVREVEHICKPIQPPSDEDQFRLPCLAALAEVNANRACIQTGKGNENMIMSNHVLDVLLISHHLPNFWPSIPWHIKQWLKGMVMVMEAAMETAGAQRRFAGWEGGWWRGDSQTWGMCNGMVVARAEPLCWKSLHRLYVHVIYIYIYYTYISMLSLTLTSCWNEMQTAPLDPMFFQWLHWLPQLWLAQFWLIAVQLCILNLLCVF